MNASKLGTEGQEPDEFERLLMRELRHVDPPAGFAARVIGRAPVHKPERRRASTKTVPVRPRWMMPRARAWVGGALAAMLVVGLFVADQAHLRQRRAQAVLAQRQFETAIRVTDRALDETRAQLEQSGLNLSN